MGNPIKYSTTGSTLSLKKGNFYFGTGDVEKGPTVNTGYLNGVTPSAGGYTIYLYNSSQPQNIAYHSANNDSQLISFTNKVAGQSFTSATQCLNWYSTQNNYACVDRDYERIVTSGMVLNMDAGFTPSYPKNGTTWYDNGSGDNNGTLVNGPTFSSSSGGILTFDGTNDSVQWASDGAITPFFNSWWNSTSRTLEMWVNFSSIGTFGVLLGVASVSYWETNSNYVVVNNKFGIYTNGNTVTNGNNLSTNTWYNVVWVRTGQSSHTLYVDGVLIGTNSAPMDITDTDTDYQFQMMRNGYGNFKQGSVSIFRLYNRSLTASEVLQNYNALSSRFSPYDSDAQAFFTAAGITDTTQKTAVNQLVLDLKSYGIWSKYSVIYPFVGGSSSTCSYNLKNPNSYQITFYGGWTFNSNGITSSVNSYGDTGFSPLLGFSSDTDYQYSIYSRTQSGATNSDFQSINITSCDEYGYVAENHNLFLSTSNQLQFYDVYGGYWTRFYSSTDGRGLFTVSRTNSTNYVAYRNGVEMTQVAGPFPNTGSRPSVNILISGLNDACYGITPSGNIKNYAFWGMGNGLTSTESANLYTAVQAFQTTLGRQV